MKLATYRNAAGTHVGPPRFLGRGDVIASQIAGIGRLGNTVGGDDAGAHDEAHA